MSDIAGVGGSGRHFTPDEEVALQQGESTNAIMHRDGHTDVDISGHDETRRAVQKDQKSTVGVGGAIEIGTAVSDAAGVSGLELGVAHAVGLGTASIVFEAVAPLALAAAALHEMHKAGHEQNVARQQEEVHAALASTLKLPPSYANKRLNSDYRDTPRGPHSNAFKMAEALRADPKAVAVLQMHCDRGMIAARDMVACGGDPAAFFKANPKVLEAYKSDAAFREGFDAFVFTKTHCSAEELGALEKGLNERDGWYAQSQVAIRV